MVTSLESVLGCLNVTDNPTFVLYVIATNTLCLCAHNIKIHIEFVATLKCYPSTVSQIKCSVFCPIETVLAMNYS